MWGQVTGQVQYAGSRPSPSVKFQTDDTYLHYNNIRTGFLITGFTKKPYANPIQGRAGPDTESSGRAGRPQKGAM